MSHFSRAQATSACFLVAWPWLYLEETEGSIEECTGIFLVLFQKGNADSHLEIDFKTSDKQFENTMVYENTNKVFFLKKKKLKRHATLFQRLWHGIGTI